MNVRRLLLAVGVVAGVAGLVLAAFPEMAVGVGANAAFVLVVGALAGLQALLDLQARRRRESSQAETDDPESGLVPPHAGADVDEALSVVDRGLDRATRQRRDEIRDRVRAAAVDVVSRREECSRERADAMLDRGTWTDDPYAAAFFGADVEENLPLGVLVRDAVRPESRFSRRASHAIAAVAERADE